ncbi:MAG: spermidine/putrescine ABC transporter substrate-binding protein [Deinococcales bacterium]
MKKLGVLALGGVVAVALLAQGAAQTRTLNLFNWSEYMDPAILKDFEKQFNAKVNVSLYESNEDLITKLRANGGSQYDVIVPGQYAIPLLARSNLLLKLDKTKIPNLKNLAKKFINPNYDPNNTYSAAYQWGTVGVVYRKDKLKNPAQTWGLFFNRAQKQGSFLMMDSTREMLGPALKYLGKSLNSTNPEDIKAALELMVQAKGRSLGFDGGVGNRNKVAAGQADYGVAYNGDVIKLQEEDKNLGFFVPQEGSVIFTDSMAIPIKAPNSQLAHQFINFILEPKIGARLSNYNRYASPNEAAKPFINPADAKNPGVYPPANVMAKLEFILDLGKNNALYDSAWTKIKAR